MVIDNVLINKSMIIERCLKRIEEEYNNRQTNLFDNITKQDSIVLNLQRASDAAIDLAMHLVRKNRLDIPQTSRDAFELLAQAGIIDSELLNAMKRMVGFRNVAVHQYEKLNLDIVKSIIESHLSDFRLFVDTVKGER